MGEVGGEGGWEGAGGGVSSETVQHMHLRTDAEANVQFHEMVIGGHIRCAEGEINLVMMMLLCWFSWADVLTGASRGALGR